MTSSYLLHTYIVLLVFNNTTQLFTVKPFKKIVFQLTKFTPRDILNHQYRKYLVLLKFPQILTARPD